VSAALCLSSIAAGAATGRYTNIARPQDAWSLAGAQAAAPGGAPSQRSASARRRLQERRTHQSAEAPVLLSVAIVAEPRATAAE
jgi:hypothetical protein